MAAMQDVEHAVGENQWPRQGLQAGRQLGSRAQLVKERWHAGLSPARQHHRQRCA
jgi:hypothetical protein